MNVNRISCYALALSCLLASCKDEMKDEEMPTVSITSPKADTKVWLETTLAADVIDNQGVSKVEFYLDGDLIGEDTEAPYELSLDTEQYEDGTYVLRTVAFDGANNRSEAERDVEIQNTLLTVEVESGHFGESSLTRKWVMVSDVKGNILQTKEIENGTKYTFDRPEGFPDSLVSATFFHIYKESNDYGSASAYTYYGISPDKWTLLGYDNDEKDNTPTTIGEATGSFTASNSSYYIHSPKSEGWVSSISTQHYADDSAKRNFTIDLYQNATHLYLATFPENEIPQYKIFRDIQAGDHHDLTPSDYKSMKLIKTIDLPRADDASAYVVGKYKDEDQYRYDVSKSSLDDNTNTISLYQPENIFSSLEYTLYIYQDNLSYYRYDEDQVPSSYTIPDAIDYSVANHDRMRCVNKTGHETILILCTYEKKKQQQKASSIRCSLQV